MNSLEDRRTIFRILFILSLINGNITAPNLLSSLNFKVPLNFINDRFTRYRNETNQQLLLTTNISDIDPCNQMKIKFNKYYQIFDLNCKNDIVKKN